ncbi:MAG: hypothetical protein K0R61_1527 [Microvirga sp.]|nr:hypothetical protein [Microvirga sp.]
MIPQGRDLAPAQIERIKSFFELAGGRRTDLAKAERDFRNGSAANAGLGRNVQGCRARCRGLSKVNWVGRQSQISRRRVLQP